MTKQSGSPDLVNGLYLLPSSALIPFIYLSFTSGNGEIICGRSIHRRQGAITSYPRPYHEILEGKPPGAKSFDRTEPGAYGWRSYAPPKCCRSEKATTEPWAFYHAKSGSLCELLPRNIQDYGQTETDLDRRRTAISRASKTIPTGLREVS